MCVRRRASRCCSNPSDSSTAFHWTPISCSTSAACPIRTTIEQLRPLTGRDEPVVRFLEGESSVGQMLGDIRRFLARWLPAFARDNRSYVTDRHRLHRWAASFRVPGQYARQRIRERVPGAAATPRARHRILNRTRPSSMTRARPRPILAGAMLTLWTSAACLAADWQRVPAAGDDQHFYDRSNVTIAGDEVTYWRKVMFAQPVRVKGGLARSAFYRERVHCRDHTLRTLSWQLFADEGAVIESSTAPEAEAAPIVPETVGDRFQELVCGLAEARRKRDADIAGQEALLRCPAQGSRRAEGRDRPHRSDTRKAAGRGARDASRPRDHRGAQAVSAHDADHRACADRRVGHALRRAPARVPHWYRRARLAHLLAGRPDRGAAGDGSEAAHPAA